jgi:hypothetical protein
MQSKQSKPSRFIVDIWVDGRGYDVSTLSPGETGLAYHIRVRSIRAPTKTVDLKTIALATNGGSKALVVFSHPTPLEWICSVPSSKATPGTANLAIDVDQTTGQSAFQALELALSDPFGPTTEILRLDLPLTIM